MTKEKRVSVARTRGARSANVELLRIFAMIGIVMSHLCFSSIHANEIIQAHNSHTFFLVLIQASGQIGVFIFFIISGYFMSKKEVKIKSIAKLVGITWFYSALLFAFALVVAAFGATQFFQMDPSAAVLNIHTFFKNLTPIMQNNYWFITAYIVIMMMSPALNKIVTGTTKRAFTIGLVIAIVLFFTLNYIGRFMSPPMHFELYSNLLLYSIVYLVGAYFAFYPPKITTKQLLFLLGLSTLAYLGWRYHIFYQLDSPDLLNKDIDFPPFAISIAIFALFLRLKITSYTRMINLIAGTTLAVYLIHTNLNIWRFIWHVFDVYSVFATPLIYIYPFIVSLIVFMICFGIEIIRQYSFRKLSPYCLRLMRGYTLKL